MKLQKFFSQEIIFIFPSILSFLFSMVFVSNAGNLGLILITLSAGIWSCFMFNTQFDELFVQLHVKTHRAHLLVLISCQNPSLAVFWCICHVQVPTVCVVYGTCAFTCARFWQVYLGTEKYTSSRSYPSPHRTQPFMVLLGQAVASAFY